MAKANLQNIATSGTFQNWFDKTNEIVNIIKTDTLTAGGDTTNGNAILAGNFTATNVIANTLLQTDGIGPKTGGATIQVNADTKINGASQAALIVSHGTGGQAQFTNGSITWNAGLKDSNGNFIIDTGAGDDKFSLATNGMLTVPNLTAIENVTAVSFIGDGSQLTGVVSSVAVNELTDVTITNASSGQVLKYNGTAWVNEGILHESEARTNLVPHSEDFSTTTNFWGPATGRTSTIAIQPTVTDPTGTNNWLSFGYW